MMLITKFWRTKLVTLVASIGATAAVWVSLAWPDLTAAQHDASPEEVAAALQYLAAVSAPVEPPPEAPAHAAAPPPEVHRVYVVTRRTITQAAPDGLAPGSVEQPGDVAPEQTVASAPPPTPAPARQTQTRQTAPQPAAAAPAPAPAPAPKPAPTPVQSKGS